MGISGERMRNHSTNGAVTITVFVLIMVMEGCLVSSASFDYKSALTKSIMFLEAQRSGKLPSTNRIPWRGDSALDDGKEVGVDLTGGYYDAGDNVKYGLPMAFTISTLAWSATAYEKELQNLGELDNVRAGVRWGADYFLKTCVKEHRLYVQVGDPIKDHQCWIRPENMKGPRPVLKIDEGSPGSEIAAETAAALAAASLCFRHVDYEYSKRLINKAKLLFEFARHHKGTYDGECPFYCSFSGFNDELQWAGTWLFMATRNETYLHYVEDESVDATVNEFNWDLKYAGTQILLTELFYEGKAPTLDEYKAMADSYVCSVHPDSPVKQAPTTPGGLLYMRDGANTQYATGAALLFSIYSGILERNNLQVNCSTKNLTPAQVMDFAKKQMDYILGDNPKQRSYMVGFGKNPPLQAHHRGASVPVLPPDAEVNCGLTFVKYFTKDAPNPNELTGAIVGGPDKNDEFEDKRSIGNYEEPCTYINSQAIGVLAKLASM